MTQDYIYMYISDVYPFKCVILMVRKTLIFSEYNIINKRLTRKWNNGFPVLIYTYLLLFNFIKI